MTNIISTFGYIVLPSKYPMQIITRDDITIEYISRITDDNLMTYDCNCPLKHFREYIYEKSTIKKLKLIMRS